MAVTHRYHSAHLSNESRNVPKRTKQKSVATNLPKLIGKSAVFAIKLPHSDTRWVWCSTGCRQDAPGGYESALETRHHAIVLIAMRKAVPAAQSLLDAMIDAKLVTLATLPALWDDLKARNMVVVHGRKRALDDQALAELLWRELTSHSIDHWINVWAPLPPEPIHRGTPARPEQKLVNLRMLRLAMPDAKDLTPDTLTATWITARINSLVNPHNGKAYSSGYKTCIRDAFSMLCHYLVRDDVAVITRNPCLGNRVTFTRTDEENEREDNKRGYTLEETTTLCEAPAPPRKPRARRDTGQTTVEHYRAAIALAWAAGIEKQVLGLLQGKHFFALEMNDDYKAEAVRLGIPMERLQRLFHAKGTKTKTRTRTTFATNVELWDRFIWPVVKHLKPNEYLLPRAAKGASPDAQWTRLRIMHERICAATGIPFLGRWHVFRHGHATAMDDAIGVVAGVNERFANQTGGWSNRAKTRKRRYVHEMPPAEFLASVHQYESALEEQASPKKKRGKKVLPFALVG